MVLQGHLDLDVYKPLWEKHLELEENNERFPIVVSDSIKANEHYIPQIKEFLLAKNIDYQMESVGLTPAVDSLFINFKKIYPTSHYLSSIQKRAAKWLEISPGKIAPDFTGTTIDGKPLSLIDLRGKIVYIDVWATWCGPCREEFPFSKKLQKLFESNDDVVFLYVSIDKDEEAWKKMVLADKSFNGTHIIQQDGQIGESYLIRGVPRYILIDSEGKIVKPEAPRPSSGKVENEIHELLKK